MVTPVEFCKRVYTVDCTEVHHPIQGTLHMGDSRMGKYSLVAFQPSLCACILDSKLATCKIMTSQNYLLLSLDTCSYLLAGKDLQ